ncbi:hypothetical protein OAB00_03105, partial [Akkermansiaceae bacterium]|nr:hypothetical protein [Akkermansiaceae bacterium]
ETTRFLKQWQPHACIIDTNQHPNYPNLVHNTPQQAIAIANDLDVRDCWLSHLSCATTQWLKETNLPKGVSAARDGLSFNV